MCLEEPVKDVKDMIKDGSPIKRNVFLNAGSNEVIGVTEHGKSTLSLYYYNSKLFRYGVWILVIVDIFVGFLISLTAQIRIKTSFPWL